LVDAMSNHTTNLHAELAQISRAHSRLANLVNNTEHRLGCAEGVLKQARVLTKNPEVEKLINEALTILEGEIE